MQFVGSLYALLKSRSAAVGAVASAVLLVAAVLIAQSSPRSELDVRLSDGAVWLPSTAIGGISLLDGGSGTIAASLGVADPGDDFSVEQYGSDAVIVNRTDGTVARLDGSSWTIATGRVQFGVPGQPLDVVTGETSGWMMTPGQASTLDMKQLATRAPVPIAAPFASGIMTDSGALLYASSDPELPVQRLETAGGDVSLVTEIDGPTALVDLGRSVGGVDLDDRKVWLDGEGVVCDGLEFPEGSTLNASGGDEHLIVVSDQGGAFVWSPMASGCPSVDDFINLGPGTYGVPALTDGWAVVPETATGSVLVIDLDAMSVTSRQELDGVAAGTDISLIAEDGAIWYNDPTSAQAGLIRRDGTIVPVAKYEDGATGFTSAPVDDAPDDADDVSVAGAQQQELEDQTPDAETVAGPELTTTTLAGGTDDGSDQEDAPAGTTSTTQSVAPDTDDETTDETTTETTEQGGDGDPGDGDPGDPGTSTTSTTQPEPDPIIKITMGVSALSVTEGETINFTALTAHGTPNNWSIEFSPTGPQIQPIENFGSFRVLFPRSGTFTASLTACDADGNCDTARTQVTIVADPDAIPLVAGIGGSANVQVGDTITLSDISQGEPDSWNWDTDGGSPASSSNSSVDVSWATEGTKTVSLTVTDGGQTDTATFAVQVAAGPTPAPFGLTCSPSSLDTGSTSTCQLNGSVADFSNITFSTSADGDGGFSSSSPSAGRLTLSHTVGGPVTVTLAATDDGTGFDVSDTAVVTFNEVICPAVIPTVTAGGPATLETGTAGSFSSTVSATCGTSVYSWTATGPASISNPNAAASTISWSSAGTYTVTIDYSDGSGPGSASRSVTVEDPVAGPSAPSISINGSATLDTDASGSFSAANTGGPIDSYAWSTNGGGGSSSNATLNASWSTAGDYTVTLVASGPGGSDTATYDVTVEDPPPQPSPFGMTCDVSSREVDLIFNCDLTTGDPADFSNPQWSASPASAQSWLMNPWSFDAAGTVIGSTVTVTLSATDLATGLTVSASDSVSITAPPIPALGLTCSPTTRPADGATASTCSISNASEFSGVSFSSNQPSANVWGAPGQFFVAWDQVGTVNVSATATHTASGTPVSAGPVSITFEAVAPPPANMTVSCSLLNQRRARCSLSSGNSGSFSGPSWSVSPAAASLTWGGSAFEIEVGSNVANQSFTVTLTATDIGTGQVVSASGSITIPEVW